MKKVMSARNAFAHGRFSSDQEHVWLSYFEGTPRKQELTDEYLTQIETLLREAVSKAYALAVKIGAKRPPAMQHAHWRCAWLTIDLHERKGDRR